MVYTKRPPKSYGGRKCCHRKNIFENHCSRRCYHKLFFPRAKNGSPIGPKGQESLQALENKYPICIILTILIQTLSIATVGLQEPGSSVSIVSGCGLDDRAIEV
jgi:hypothetical protein